MSTLDINIVFVEILPRLPLKSLIRFKCVSKSFRTTISSWEFVKLYLRHQPLYSNNFLIFPENRRGIVCYDITSHPFIPAVAAFDWDIKGSVFVVGSSNGLVCFFTCSNVNYFSVLNPSTRLYKYIRTWTRGRRDHGFGFAFDHEYLDYKIVVVDGYDDKYGFTTRVTKVYSLNTNSWKQIESASPPDLIKETDGGALIKNHLLHWMFWNSSLCRHRIGCFDVCKNKWVDDVILPRFYNPDKDNCLLSLGVLDDCLYSSFENRNDSCFEVWVMKEYGVQDSWFKLLTIPVSKDMGSRVVSAAYRSGYDEVLPVGRGVVPVACRGGSDQVLIRQRHSSRLFWYDRVNGGTTEARFNGAPNFSDLEVCMCSTSPVDFPGSKLFQSA